MVSHAELAELNLPEFGVPLKAPQIPSQTYLDRIQSLKEKATQKGYGAFIVYGDREHFANMAWLIGYDPRFEEALLLIDLERNDKPILIVGNEGIGYTDVSPIKEHLKVILFQSFSLVSQPRGHSTSLKEVLKLGGVKRGTWVGVAGWKYYTSEETTDPETTLEIPSYIADAIRLSTGKGNVFNANNLLIHPTDGIRAVNDVDQLAWFEYVGSQTSQALREVVFGIRPGMTEYDAVRLMKLNGLPLSCHLMLSTGSRAMMGLPSPTDRIMERGDPFTIAYGAWGSLNSRAGFLVENENELPQPIRDYVPRLVAPYFEAIATWYTKLRIGVTGGELYKVIHDRIGDPFFGVKLNPGHLTSLEEWLSSPIYRNSREILISGMAFQVDVIPATGSQYFTTNIEDTIAIADLKLRKKCQEFYPEAWARIQKRRSFMEKQLGIVLASEVLPFSNIPAYLPPFLLAPHKAMRITG